MTDEERQAFIAARDEIVRKQAERFSHIGIIDSDDLCDKFSRLLFERTWQHLPLTPEKPGEPFLTSDDARAAATQVLEILGGSDDINDQVEDFRRELDGE